MALVLGNASFLRPAVLSTRGNADSPSKGDCFAGIFRLRRAVTPGRRTLRRALHDTPGRGLLMSTTGRLLCVAKGVAQGALASSSHTSSCRASHRLGQVSNNMTQGVVLRLTVTQKEGFLGYPCYLSILHPGVPELECFAGARIGWGSRWGPHLQILRFEQVTKWIHIET